jgi:methionyl-tRNA formyltransferase
MEDKSMARIVVFTNKSARGAAILRQMKQRNIPIVAIIIDTTKWSQKKVGKKIQRSLNRIGPTQTIRYVLKRLNNRIVPKEKKEWQSNDYYLGYSDALYTVKSFNDEHCEKILHNIEPDLIILGGSRIIRNNIINIPKFGILNPHPGLLPEYRGVDVIPWAIYNEDPVGVTVHFIDEGVDTGSIVAKETITISEGDTFGTLMEKANELLAKLVCDAIDELLETGKIQAYSQSMAEGKQYYRMPADLRQETKEKLEHLTKSIA